MGYKTISRKLEQVYDEFHDALEEPLKKREKCTLHCNQTIDAALLACQHGCDGIPNTDKRQDCYVACSNIADADRKVCLKECEDEWKKDYEKALKKMQKKSIPLQQQIKKRSSATLYASSASPGFMYFQATSSPKVRARSARHLTR